MASTKLATLVIRTLAKPLSNQIKQQAKEHPTFRKYCVSLAQRMHRGEVKLRTNLLGESPRAIRPLSEAKAIESGANTLAEGFLFGVAALLIIGETWRSSRSSAKRRNEMDDEVEDLSNQLIDMRSSLTEMREQFEEGWAQERQRNLELTQVLEKIVAIGLRGGWAEFEDTPLKLPPLQILPSPHSLDSNSSTNPPSQGTSSTSDSKASQTPEDSQHQ